MSNGTPSPTPAADWAPTKTVELPSGRTARLRTKLSLRALLRRGEIDMDELSSLISGTLQDAQRALEIEALLLSEMFVEPEVVIGERNPGKRQIHIDNVEDDDCAFVLQLALGGAPEATTFRGDAGGDGAGSGSQNVGKGPERNAGPRDGDAGGVPTRPRTRRKAAASPA